MFMLTLPVNAPLEGNCTINGEPATYYLNRTDNTLSFGLVAEPADWDTRFIFERVPAGKNLVTYYCTDKDGEGEVVTPKPGPDGGISVSVARANPKQRAEARKAARKAEGGAR